MTTHSPLQNGSAWIWSGITSTSRNSTCRKETPSKVTSKRSSRRGSESGCSGSSNATKPESFEPRWPNTSPGSSERSKSSRKWASPAISSSCGISFASRANRGSRLGQAAAPPRGASSPIPFASLTSTRLEHGLIFERFLNPERISMPDIDIDFCEARRGEVIDYVTERYGRDNVAQIITFGTMKARAVTRDVGRVLDVPYADVDRIAKMIPAILDATLDKAVEEVPQLRDAAEADPRISRLLDVAKRLEGVSRHASTHAAGVVIAPKPLTEFLPLYRGSRGEITTQYAMKDIEDIGLLKMDFLGLRTLTLLDNCVKLIDKQLGEKIDLDRLPLDDAKTYQLFADGQTFGIFQFESDGMRDILRRFKPEKLNDLTALNALYRPGPIRSGMNRRLHQAEARQGFPCVTKCRHCRRSSRTRWE